MRLLDFFEIFSDILVGILSQFSFSGLSSDLSVTTSEGMQTTEVSVSRGDSGFRCSRPGQSVRRSKDIPHHGYIGQ